MDCVESFFYFGEHVLTTCQRQISIVMVTDPRKVTNTYQSFGDIVGGYTNYYYIIGMIL